jgi:hypothetical protein
MVGKAVRYMQHETHVPGELKDKIIKEAYSRIESYEADNIPDEEALNEIMQWLTQQEVVEGTRTLHGTDVTVRFRDGTQVGILMRRQQAYGPSSGPKGRKGGGARREPRIEV